MKVSTLILLFFILFSLFAQSKQQAKSNSNKIVKPNNKPQRPPAQKQTMNSDEPKESSIKLELDSSTQSSTTSQLSLPIPNNKPSEITAQQSLLLKVDLNNRKYKAVYKLNKSWMDNEEFKECTENTPQNTLFQTLHKSWKSSPTPILDKMILDKKNTLAFKQYDKACNANKSKNDIGIESCIVHLAQLAAEVFTIDYPLTQCILGRETIQPDGASSIANHLYQFPNDKYVSPIAPSKNTFNPSASNGNGKGLTQITSPAIKAVQELLGNKASPSRFDCSFHRKFRTFFALTSTKPPDLFYTHSDKNKIDLTEKFNPLNPIHNIAVGAGYIYDRTIRDGKVDLNSLPFYKPNYTFELRQKIANGYNPGTPPYGRAVAKCAKNVDGIKKGSDIYLNSFSVGSYSSSTPVPEIIDTNNK